MSKINISAKTREGGALPDQEIQRRLSINNLSYYIRVLLNGSKVWESEFINLKDADFSFNVQQKLQLNIYDFPENLEVQVCTKSLLFNSTIAATKLRVPGEGKKELSGNEILN